MSRKNLLYLKFFYTIKSNSYSVKKDSKINFLPLPNNQKFTKPKPGFAAITAIQAYPGTADIKQAYAQNSAKINHNSIYLNGRLFSTYNRITEKLLGKTLSGVNIDLGSGDKGFTQYCKTRRINSFPYDYPYFNIETDKLNHKDNSVDFVTLNAVI